MVEAENSGSFWRLVYPVYPELPENPEYINLLDTSGVCGWIQGAYGLI